MALSKQQPELDVYSQSESETASQWDGEISDLEQSIPSPRSPSAPPILVDRETGTQVPPPALQAAHRPTADKQPQPAHRNPHPNSSARIPQIAAESHVTVQTPGVDSSAWEITRAQLAAPSRPRQPAHTRPFTSQFSDTTQSLHTAQCTRITQTPLPASSGMAFSHVPLASVNDQLIAPTPFSAEAGQSGEEFLNHFKRYCLFKNFTREPQADLFGLLFRSTTRLAANN
jgi:hypothetical protein